MQREEEQNLSLKIYERTLQELSDSNRKSCLRTIGHTRRREKEGNGETIQTNSG